ncbi:hypothetical protein LINPERPRIM_LOCUS30621 [Linum perenne]
MMIVPCFRNQKSTVPSFSVRFKPQFISLAGCLVRLEFSEVLKDDQLPRPDFYVEVLPLI